MTVNAMSQGGTGNNLEYEFDSLSSDSDSGQPVLVPKGVKAVYFQFSPADVGSGYVTVTRSSHARIIAGTAKWKIWEAGTVSVITQDDSSMIRGFRHITVSGVTELTAIAF